LLWTKASFIVEHQILNRTVQKLWHVHADRKRPTAPSPPNSP